ncbi:hypothetical protein LMF32_05425 [Desemzia sp. C1]|uniref:hypothetical protein n=1 Tax=Desemzia sp. C1 TaxID=2892016 RepID=UPI001E38FAA8|nr:hypothetical protein [Desemzia sp. C1]MCI3028540.1 hypothetical protein [Desemzia sp. C1]
MVVYGSLEVLKDYRLEEKNEEITRWLNLPVAIAELEYERATFSSNYYQEHSFYSHVVYDDVRGIISEAPRVDLVAINIADSCLLLEQRIKRNKQQYKLFKQVVARLPTIEVDSLNDREIDDICTFIQLIRKITETTNAELTLTYQNEFKKRLENIR